VSRLSAAIGDAGPSATELGLPDVTDVVPHCSVGVCHLDSRFVVQAERFMARRAFAAAERRREERTLPGNRRTRAQGAPSALSGPTPPTPPDGPFREIELVGGAMALVDPADVGLVSSRRWYLSQGYAVSGAGVRMHRLILGIADGVEVDHITGDRLDNRRANLREATRKQNRWNSASPGGSSRFKGVSHDPWRRAWLAQIYVSGRRIYLGHFGDEELAARIYDAAARDHFGEFARLNLPDRMLP